MAPRSGPPPMTDRDLLDPVHRFHRHTRDLLALAERDDWQAFEAQAAEREALVGPLNDNDFVIAVTEAGRADELRREIEAIQRLNDRITALAEDTKADIAARLKHHNVQQKAIRAYNKP